MTQSTISAAGITETASNTQVRVATIGSVDDGKSTLIGRLLHDSKSIFEDQLSAVNRASRRYGDGSFNLALLTDGLRAEREQGITIDVAYRYFATPKRSFILADTPGHAQFTRNMVTGASVSDVAIVLVDARHGIVEQTRRHVSIASLLGVEHLIVGVNKMDLVDWDVSVFNEIVDGIRGIVDKFDSPLPVHAVPISALNGANVVDVSPELSPWYTGPSVLDLLETLEIGADNVVGARLAVQWTLRPYGGSDYRGYAGTLEGGPLAVGDNVVILPKGQTSTIVGLTRAGRAADTVLSGDAIAVELADDLDVGRGDVIVHAGHGQPVIATSIVADVCWMSEVDLLEGDALVIRNSAGEVNAVVSRIENRLDLDSIARVDTDKVQLNDVARIEFSLTLPLVVDNYRVNRTSGAAIIVDPTSNSTVGAAMVVSAAAKS